MPVWVIQRPFQYEAESTGALAKYRRRLCIAKGLVNRHFALKFIAEDVAECGDLEIEKQCACNPWVWR